MITNLHKFLPAIIAIVAVNANAFAQQQVGTLDDPFQFASTTVTQDPLQDQTQPFGNQDLQQPLIIDAQDDPVLPGQGPGSVPFSDGTQTPALPGGGPQLEIPGQTIEVNPAFAGWQAPGDANVGPRLAEALRANWVMTERNGALGGTVYGLEGSDPRGILVYLLNRGRLVTNTVTDDQGNFRFNNVVEGSYSLVGIGENAFFCFGLNVLGHRDTARAYVARRLDITAFQNETTINTDWIQYFTPQVKFRVYGVHADGQEVEDPPKYYGFEGLGIHQPAGSPATSINSHNVVKTEDGRLIGRVHQLDSLDGRPVDLGQTRIMLLKQDDVMAATTTDNYGVFEIRDVPDGQFALLAAGNDGVGLVGINVISSGSASGGPEDIVALNAANVFDFTLISSETIGWLNRYATELAYERAISAPRPPEPVSGYNNFPQCQQPQGQCYGPEGHFPGMRLYTRGGVSGAGSFGDWLKQSNRRINDFFDGIFYPEDNRGVGGGYGGGGYGYNQGPGYGYNTGGYNYNGYPQNGYGAMAGNPDCGCNASGFYRGGQAADMMPNAPAPAPLDMAPPVNHRDGYFRTMPDPVSPVSEPILDPTPVETTEVEPPAPHWPPTNVYRGAQNFEQSTNQSSRR